MTGTMLTLGIAWTVLFYCAWLGRIFLRFHWALVGGMLLLVGLLGIALAALPPFGVTLFLGFFYAFQRWEPLRGVFVAPKWPRARIHRGPGKRRAREFSEPMPWTRGPGTF